MPTTRPTLADVVRARLAHAERVTVEDALADAIAAGIAQSWDRERIRNTMRRLAHRGELATIGGGSSGRVTGARRLTDDELEERGA